mmetsp:Transcript_18282/g.33943  ORF Transcript_18282/g.33943 Transcript_18282/m.33943 type:complete len:226 (+) Transcript_18282:85-762(+)
MYNGLRHCFGSGARRLLASPASAPATRSLLPARPLAELCRARPLVRPFSALRITQHQSIAAKYAVLPQSAAKPALSALPEVASTANVVGEVVSKEAGETLGNLRQKGMVFEIGFSFLFAHYMAIFQGLARCGFQSVRPLFILFLFGQGLKVMFCIFGTPLWFSFYSFWMFEVGYGLFQIYLSLIFIGSFYNNLLFARARPALRAIVQQQRLKVARAMQNLRGALA